MNSKYKKWFQFKELAAGKNRLLLSYYIYKYFGELPLRIIAFFVVLVTFLKAKEQKEASKIYFMALEKYTNVSYKPYFLTSLKHFLNYGNSLVDKIISFSGHIDPKKFHFSNNDIDEINELLKTNKGIFFITTHIGNNEILRSLMQASDLEKPKKINVFMDRTYCKIFNDFLKNIEIDFNTTTCSLDDIDVEVGITLSDKLDNGEIVFMAGDRIAKTNPQKFYSINFLNRKINLPIGAMKLVLALNAPVFFITCAKTKKGYEVMTHKFNMGSSKKENLEKIKKEYGNFLEECTLKYPYQFFNFFNIFED